jgi:hypothetical protein
MLAGKVDVVLPALWRYSLALDNDRFQVKGAGRQLVTNLDIWPRRLDVLKKEINKLWTDVRVI